jgi:putative SOS response-associated peptidase YedK
MCGRFTLRTPAAQLAEAFELFREPELTPRYNIAPSQMVAAIRFEEERTPRELVLLKWGLIPFWAKDPKIGNRLINARAETVATTPAFRAAFQRRRCLIPADGFYEWKRLDAKHKQPYYIARPDRGPFAFAGLWERWRPEGGDAIESCTIITTDANETMAPLHDRMPVILPPSAYDHWLDPGRDDASELQSLLRPCPPDDLTLTAVSTLVNSPRNESADCLRPADTQGELFT